jgi:hypothetical protein
VPVSVLLRRRVSAVIPDIEYPAFSALNFLDDVVSVVLVSESSVGECEELCHQHRGVCC